MVKTLLLLIFAFSFTSIFGSNNDSIPPTKVRKNIIRWNMTPWLIVGPKSIVLGYERVLGDWQSASINIGYLEKSPLTDAEGVPLDIFNQNSRGGLDISADYRFYFKKKNKYKAPDGLYWGPYVSYLALWHDASINILDNDAIVNTANYSGSFSMTGLGVQLGYQFIIKERFAIDLILMGPSYTYYNLNLSLNYDQKISADDPFYQDLYDLINDASPLLANFIKEGSIDANGRMKFSYYGFRYAIQIGYRF